MITIHKSFKRLHSPFNAMMLHMFYTQFICCNGRCGLYLISVFSFSMAS